MTVLQKSERERWDLRRFGRNLPQVVVPEVDIDRDGFEQAPLGRVTGVRVLDMPISMPGVGLRFPETIWPFSPIITTALSNDVQYYPSFASMYVYVTIDQKHVQAGGYGRRPGAHSDGYIATDDRQLDIIAENADAIADVIEVEQSYITHTYIWHDSVPTEFFNVPFPLSNGSDEGSLRRFDEIADACRPDEIVTYPNKSLLMLTPYVVHRCAVVPEDTYRTFVKVSVSDKQWRREGNTHNDLFDYDWSMDKRSPSKVDPMQRNTPWRT